MTLTKEEAIRRHRTMWEWIANETLRRHACVDKIDAFIHFGWFDECPVNSWCWCCEYSSTDYSFKGCDYCPIKWPGVKEHRSTCTMIYLDNDLWEYGLFAKWSENSIKGDWRTAAYYALYISMLPERKDV